MNDNSDLNKDLIYKFKSSINDEYSKIIKKIDFIFEKIENDEFFPEFSLGEDLFTFVSTKEEHNLKYQLIVRITKKCNLRCIYCFVDHKQHSNLNIIKYFFIKLARCKKKRNIELVFSGGEPTLSNLLIPLVNLFLKTAILRIQIQTNAIKFSDIDYLNKFKQSKKLIFFVGFPSFNEKTYNFLTKSRSFKKALQGLKNISSRFYLVVNFVINSKNYKEINENLFIFIKNNLSNSSLIISQIAFLDESTSFLLVKYSELIPVLRRAYSLAKKYDINFSLTNIDGCGLPKCVRMQIRNETEPLKFIKENPDFKKDKICKSCYYNKFCYGFRKIYVDKFGFDGIKPFKDENNFY